MSSSRKVRARLPAIAYRILAGLGTILLFAAPAAAQSELPAGFQPSAAASIEGPIRVKARTRYEFDHTYSLVIERLGNGDKAVEIRMSGDAAYVLEPGERVGARATFRNLTIEATGDESPWKLPVEKAEISMQLDWDPACLSYDVKSIQLPPGFGSSQADIRGAITVIGHPTIDILWCFPNGVAVGSSYTASPRFMLGNFLIDTLNKLGPFKGRAVIRAVSIGAYAGRRAYLMRMLGNFYIEIGTEMAISGVNRSDIVVDAETGLVLKRESTLSMGGTKESGGPLLVRQRMTQNMRQIRPE